VSRWASASAARRATPEVPRAASCTKPRDTA
jgi:hypothetical protein